VIQKTITRLYWGKTGLELLLKSPSDCCNENRTHRSREQVQSQHSKSSKRLRWASHRWWQSEPESLPRNSMPLGSALSTISLRKWVIRQSLLVVFLRKSGTVWVI
jgi:hypothetical protein